jgi:hypothetical protein
VITPERKVDLRQDSEIAREPGEEPYGSPDYDAVDKIQCPDALYRWTLLEGQKPGSPVIKGIATTRAPDFLNVPKVGRIKTDSSNPYNGRDDL